LPPTGSKEEASELRLISVADASAAVRGRRADLGLSQRDLAARAGVSRKWIYEFEAGKPKAELGCVLRVFDALGIALVADIGDAAPRGDASNAVDLDVIIADHRRG
jgi:HTH-type transcriptional regulator / antitoxin HipB